MEKTMRQPSDTFAVAALLALAGGFLDAYTYLCRGGVFANAQTGNMVLLALRAAEGRWQEAAAYLAPILAFALGVLAAELLRRKVEKAAVCGKVSQNISVHGRAEVGVQQGSVHASALECLYLIALQRAQGRENKRERTRLIEQCRQLVQ